MAETRKFDPTDGDNDLQRQVREALGETVRPVEPGRQEDVAAAPAVVGEPAAAEGISFATLNADAGAVASFLYYGPEGSSAEAQEADRAAGR